jgi:hypothetical protein
MERLRFVPAPPAGDRRRLWVGLGGAALGGALVLTAAVWMSERANEPEPEPTPPPSAATLLDRLGLRRAGGGEPAATTTPVPAPTSDALVELREATAALARARAIACERLDRARAAQADPRAIELLAREIAPCPTAAPAAEAARQPAPDGRTL